jgi:hypothetical protein
MNNLAKGGEDGCFMGCQYQYFFVSNSNPHGFLSHYASECTNPILQKGIKENRPTEKETFHETFLVILPDSL